MSKLKITYKKSAIGYKSDQRATLNALGLKRLNQTVELADNASIRGMIHKVRHLVGVNGLAPEAWKPEPEEAGAAQ